MVVFFCSLFFFARPAPQPNNAFLLGILTLNLTPKKSCLLSWLETCLCWCPSKACFSLSLDGMLPYQCVINVKLPSPKKGTKKQKNKRTYQSTAQSGHDSPKNSQNEHFWEKDSNKKIYLPKIKIWSPSHDLPKNVKKWTLLSKEFKQNNLPSQNQIWSPSHDLPKNVKNEHFWVKNLNKTIFLPKFQIWSPSHDLPKKSSKSTLLSKEFKQNNLPSQIQNCGLPSWLNKQMFKIKRLYFGSLPNVLNRCNLLIAVGSQKSRMFITCSKFPGLILMFPKCHR